MTFDESLTLKSQELVASYRRGELTRDVYLDRLRHNVHSVHAYVRMDAIRLIEALPEPERTRELIQLAHESRWRETQIAIVQALSRQPTQRGLEFLIHLAADDHDLSLCREAIAALGRSRAPLAARYLATRYCVGPAALKPYLAHALGELLDGALITQFVKDLHEACQSEQILWAQSLVLALTELKVSDCVDTLVKLSRAEPRSIAMSALLALGKLSRDPSILDASASDFGDDFVEWQIRTNARHQIELRARWSIEDYLEQIFDLDTPFHPGLALELNHFPAEEVRAGLELFQETAYGVRLAQVLAHLRHADVSDWYAAFLDPAHLEDTAFTAVLEAMQYRVDDALEPTLVAWQERCLASPDDILYEAWLRTCVLTLPEGGRVLMTFMRSDAFSTLCEARKILVINQLADHGLAVLGDERRLKMVVHGLETLLGSETEPRVIRRVLRAFAQIRRASARAVRLAKKYLEHWEVLPAALHFFQFCPQKNAIEWILNAVRFALDNREIMPSLLWAMAAQEGSSFGKPHELDRLLHAALAGDMSQEAHLAALGFLCQHPRKALFERVLDLTHGSDRLRVAAIVSLKSFADPHATPALVSLLDVASASIMGRALDTLTAQPDDDARWAMIELLDTCIDDVDIVDKIVRCLTPPRRHRQRFFERLQMIVETYPDHEMLEGLIQLRDRMAPTIRGENAQATLPEAAAHKLDDELSQRLDGFMRLDERVKAALRSAELPYLYPDVFHGEVDKSTSILQYCKAVDLFLERHLGGELVFPKLRDNLATFQNTVYRVGLNGPYPNPDLVIKALGLQGRVTPETLPLSKMIRVAQSVLNGRIQHVQWRILDGLRAWSAVLLLFVRSDTETSTHRPPAPIQLAGTTNRVIIELALHLDHLQQLRNPVAHRRTLVEFADIETIRNDMAELFAILVRVFP